MNAMANHSALIRDVAREMAELISEISHRRFLDSLYKAIEIAVRIAGSGKVEDEWEAFELLSVAAAAAETFDTAETMDMVDPLRKLLCNLIRSLQDELIQLMKARFYSVSVVTTANGRARGGK